MGKKNFPIHVLGPILATALNELIGEQKVLPICKEHGLSTVVISQLRHGASSVNFHKWVRVIEAFGGKPEEFFQCLLKGDSKEKVAEMLGAMILRPKRGAPFVADLAKCLGFHNGESLVFHMRNTNALVA